VVEIFKFSSSFKKFKGRQFETFSPSHATGYNPSSHVSSVMMRHQFNAFQMLFSHEIACLTEIKTRTVCNRFHDSGKAL